MRTAPLDPQDARELDVLAHYAAGHRPRDIARKLKISTGCVSGILWRDKCAFPAEPLREAAQ